MITTQTSELYTGLGVKMTDLINVLYLEDDEVDVQNMEREFGKVNPSISIHIAKNGMDALDKLLGTNGKTKISPAPRAIILDINLPKMDGIEFLTQLRQQKEFLHTFVFILTSTYTTKDKLAIQHLNVSGCIIKPMKRSDALNIFWCITSDYQSTDVLF